MREGGREDRKEEENQLGGMAPLSILSSTAPGDGVTKLTCFLVELQLKVCCQDSIEVAMLVDAGRKVPPQLQSLLVPMSTVGQ